MPNLEDQAIIVKRQNFDTAMKSIKDFSDQATEHEPLARVSYSEGLFDLFDHKVTGTELNRVVSQIEDQLVDFKNYNLGFLDLITNIYKALDALDQEHISGILIAANAAKVASDKATKNVEAIEKIVKILKDFKEKLEKLEHLMDVDKAWKLLDEQQRLIKSFGAYQSALSKIKRLHDIDKLWDKAALQAKSLTDIEKILTQTNKTLEVQEATISGFTDIINDISKNQQSFIHSVNQRLTQYQEDTDRHFDEREKEIQDTLTSLTEAFDQNHDKIRKRIEAFIRSQSDRISQVEKTQAERLDAIHASQSEALSQISDVQSTTLTNIEKNQADTFEQIRREQIERLDTIQTVQAEALKQISEVQSTTLANIETTHTSRLNQLTENQAEVLDQLAKTQVERLDAINKSLENEKSVLSKAVAALSRKVKIAYALAGGAAFIAIIQLLLNITGVL